MKRRLEEPEPAARAAAVRRLAGALDEASLRLVLQALADPHPYVRRASAGVLGVVLDRSVRSRLLRDLPAMKDARARADSTRAFAAWADVDGRTGLLRALGDGDPEVRAEAARWLGEDPDDAAGRALLLAVADTDGGVRASALDALAARAKSPSRPAASGPGPASPRAKGSPRPSGGQGSEASAFQAGLKDKDPRVRISALEGSVALGSETAVFAVAHGLDDAVWSVRLVAAELAGAVRDRRMLGPLIEALRDARDRVAQAACTSLVRLTGIPFDASPARWKSWLEGDGKTFDPAEAPARRAVPFESGGSTVAPVTFLDLPVASGHVAFVLDASGSMREPDGPGTTRWDRACTELTRVIDRLGTSAEGNVIFFSDHATSVFREAVRFAPAAREKLKEALLARKPAGKTALYDGIALALRDPAIDTVIVLSDGAPSAGEFFTKADLRAEVRRANRWRHARIDVVAVGIDEVAKRWRTMLRELTEDHGGRLVTR